MTKVFRTGIGKDSHRFLSDDIAKPLVIGGIIIDDASGFHANSDGDVILHALCNAISSITGVRILGAIADELCLHDGITDSRVYVEEALKTLGDEQIHHVACVLEALKPKFAPYIDQMRASIAEILSIDISQVGITATTGEGLTECGRGAGVEAICIVTTYSCI
jgi:2-C-methyl-D-erythritol 2,4-cyclodiphosphate synthase